MRRQVFELPFDGRRVFELDEATTDGVDFPVGLDLFITGLLASVALALASTVASFGARRATVLSLILVHLMALAALLSTAVAQWVPRIDARPFLVVAALITVVILAHPATHRDGATQGRQRERALLAVTVVLAAFAMGTSALSTAGFAFFWLDIALGSATVVFFLVVSALLALRSNRAGEDGNRARGAAVACLFASAAVVFALFSPTTPAGPCFLAAAAALLTSLRVPPFRGPRSRDWWIWTSVCVGGLFAAVPAYGLQAVMPLLSGGVLLLGAFAVGRAFPSLRRQHLVIRPQPVTGPVEGVRFDPDDLRSLVPIRDHARVRGRLPGPLASYPASDVVAGALAKLDATTRARMMVEREGDASVEGELSSLTQALAHVLQLAAGATEAEVVVHLRGTPGGVSLEIDSLQPLARGPRTREGLMWARSEAVVLRHGGSLIEGANGLHIALPRRRRVTELA